MFVAFTTASGLFDNAFNKIACAATGNLNGFCHVEVGCNTTVGDLIDLKSRLGANRNDRMFATLSELLEAYPLSTPRKEPVVLAFHAFYGSPLGVRILSPHCPDPLYQPYNEENWKVYNFAGASESIVRAQTAWCLSKVGDPYDTFGALLSPMRSFHKAPGAVEPDPESWWCSAHSLRFIQHLGMLNNCSLRGCTPNNLEVKLCSYKDTNPSQGSSQRKLDLGSEHWGVINNVIQKVVPPRLRSGKRD